MKITLDYWQIAAVLETYVVSIMTFIVFFKMTRARFIMGYIMVLP
jgi:hypothetical protein